MQVTEFPPPSEAQADVGSSREVSPEVGVLTEAMLDEERMLREEYFSRESSVEVRVCVIEPVMCLGVCVGL